MGRGGETPDAKERFGRRPGGYCGSHSMGEMTGPNIGTGMNLYDAPAEVDASNSDRQLGRRPSHASSWDDDRFRADTLKCVEGCWGMALPLLSMRASGGHWGGSVVHTSTRVPHQLRSAFLYPHQAPCDGYD